MIIEIGIVAVVTVLALGGVYEYARNKDKADPAAATADALIADAKAVVEKLEAYAADEAKKVEDYLTQQSGLAATIASVQADIQKAKDFADKVKAIL